MGRSHIAIRDHLYLLWVICGGRYLRAHNGTAYYYDSSLGCFEQFTGLLPQELYGNIRVFTVRPEGLFRSFTGRVGRDDDSLLQAIDTSVKTYSSYDVALSKYEDFAIFNRGNGLLRKQVPSSRPRLAAQGSDAVEMAEDDLNGEADTEHSTNLWYILMGQATPK